MNKIYIFLALFIIVSPIKLIPNQFLLSNSEINRSEIVLSTPPARIKVQSPDGGEIWYAGTSNTIKWDDNIIEDVVIELYKGGIFYSTILDSTPSDKSEVWDIPLNIESGSDYKVKISSLIDPGLFDFSKNNFTILRNYIVITSPNGGENWQAGSSQLITWNDNISENVTIELFKGGSFHS
ncbi:MAG: Ser-Thr-rich GPI-anchored membrane family protein, partial [Ignavibacteriaceae bacterium]